MSKTIAIACLQQGKAHIVNEDNFYLAGGYAAPGELKSARKTCTGTVGLQFFAVGDGMGGKGLGDESVHLALHVLGQHARKQPAAGRFDFSGFAQKYISDANRAVCAHLSNSHEIVAGTTISLLAIDNDTAYTASLGNSRIYLYREGQLHRLTRDHLAPLPEIQKLSRQLGLPGDLVLTEEDNLTRTVLARGDILLLATDGLTSRLSDDQIAALLARPAAFVQQIDNMFQLVSRQEGEDDLALVAIKILDPDFAAGTQDYDAAGGRLGGRILAWLKPVLFFLLFGLLGFLAGKLIFTLPGWLRQLGG